MLEYLWDTLGKPLEISLIKDSYIFLFMILTSDILRMFLMAVPDDFTIEYDNKKTIVPVEDKIEIDISCKRIIFKS